jgi:tellurite resistance protein TehA-like permease
VRQAASPALGGVVVLALIAACAVGLPRRAAALVVAAGIGCFVLVHLVAAVTVVGLGLAVGALLFAAIGWRAWRHASSSSARRATPAT